MKLKEFQLQAVKSLFEAMEKPARDIVLKSPTGSGKTIILTYFMHQYIQSFPKTVFVWLTPGKGNLEEQSKEKMDKYIHASQTKLLSDVMTGGFEENDSVFINWEKLTKKGNNALKDSERTNFLEHIAHALNDGLHFVIIVDESHQNNTIKADEIIQYFHTEKIIRCSATPKGVAKAEIIEIPEEEVIAAGLIKKMLIINEDFPQTVTTDDQTAFLLDRALAKQRDLRAAFLQRGTDINPLIVVQIPNKSESLQDGIERYFEAQGITYENGRLACWLSDQHENLPNIEAPDGVQEAVIIKQAVATGWDCPRAHILVKLRDNMDETFEIQTVGRIRRMPEAKHYEDDLLDFCYVYTFDEKYKAGLLSSIDKAYETRRLFLKDKCKTFTLEKEIRDLDFDGLGEREVLIKIHEALVAKYHLGSDKKQNQMLLADAGYIFGAEIHGQALQGEFVRTSALTESHSYITTHKRIDTHKHGMQLMHSIDAIKSSIGMAQNKVKTILERLFRKGGATGRKLIALETAEFYAFVINNQHKLKEEFREVTAQMAVQLSYERNPKRSTFRIPEQDFFRYDPNVKGEVEYLSNAYHEYTSGFATSLIRSTCEMLFEQHCEGRDDIEWVYKNGDTGQQYFSIVYVDGIQKQWLFYADYIVMKKDGTVWVIETKGGEARGQDKNIDRQIENKFNAFKAYAAKHNLHWGFVRDKDNQLYINNTEFAEDMADDHWVPLTQEF